MNLPRDILGVIRGLQAVAKAGIQLQQSAMKDIWQNSSVRSLAEEFAINAQKKTKTSFATTQNPTDIIKIVSDSSDRLYTVIDGVKRYVTYSTQSVEKKERSLKSSFKSKNAPTPFRSSIETEVPLTKEIQFEIKLTPSDKQLLKKLDMEHQAKLKAAAEVESEELLRGKEKQAERKGSFKTKISKSDTLETIKSKETTSKIKAIPNPKSRQSLSALAKERTVPASRIARMVSFGGLAASLGVGTAVEFVRRTVGVGDNVSSNAFLSRANMDRIVDTLCKVRGAALKIGQMLSIQDESIISPELSQALERVRKSADFMPSWQLEQTMKMQLGDNWKSLLSEFEEKPFAAASIGQVHWGKTVKGDEVAVKVQYPGVAKGIESDIDNLVSIMKVWNVFPKGMFIDNVVTVAKRELAWEVNYIREAECTKKFRQLLKPYPSFYVPKVIDELCSAQVFTTEFIEGIPVDQCINLEEEHRKFIANKIMQLCLLELLEFQYMQTDPNWANFFYNPQTKKILLLDFGASREYSKQFVDKYVRVIKAASENDRETVLNISKELGFLTGYENKIMEEAHVDTVMILGEIFQVDGEYSFKGQDTIVKIQNLVPTLLAHRLCPPPEEIYSLHRKLSGVFLLCAKLDTAINARKMFLELYDKYEFGSA